MPYDSPLRLLSLSEWIAAALNVSMPIAEAFTCILVLCFFFIPMLLMKSTQFVYVTISLFFLTVFTMIGWLPAYLWILIAVMISYMIAQKIRRGF